MAKSPLYILLSWCGICALTACVSVPPTEPEPEFQSIAVKTPLVKAVEGMARQLFQTRRYVTSQTPIAVTSFVDLAALEQTSVLGNQMSESFVHQLQANGLRVVEFKAPGYIKVTPKGDFALSRDYKTLKEQVPIDYILTGTYSKQSQGLLVNVKLFAAQSRIVVATAQGLVPKSVYEEEKEPPRLTGHHHVKLEHGMLVRSAPSVTQPESDMAEPETDETKGVAQ